MKHTGLTFKNLRDANRNRLPLFRNKKGGPAHSEIDGSDWELSTWCNAVLGELGELASLIKKVERGDFTLEEARDDLGKECADVVTYLDILAMRIGVDLGRVTMAKFNEVSKRVSAPIEMIASEGGDWSYNWDWLPHGVEKKEVTDIIHAVWKLRQERNHP